MTLDDCLNRARRRLLEAGHTDREARWVLRDTMAALKGYREVDMVVHGSDEVTDWLAGKIDGVVGRVCAGEPLQYVLGEARFMGMTLKVTPDVLIPRPETEQLVDMAVDAAGGREDLSVKDVGTGSGCIAVALARALKFASVEGTDISDGALALARQNAADLRARVTFVKEDILTVTPPKARYDIIVSNPPYITEAEKSQMERNVTDHEPHAALFVPDDDPVRFYRAISRYAATALRPGGDLWFEINPLFAEQTRGAVADAGFMDVSLLRDERGLLRFVHARFN